MSHNTLKINFSFISHIGVL